MNERYWSSAHLDSLPSISVQDPLRQRHSQRPEFLRASSTVGRPHTYFIQLPRRCFAAAPEHQRPLSPCSAAISRCPPVVTLSFERHRLFLSSLPVLPWRAWLTFRTVDHAPFAPAASLVGSSHLPPTLRQSPGGDHHSNHGAPQER